MTNEKIIANFVEENKIEEEIHTFAKWKELGFKIKKGEKAAYKLDIWKNFNKKVVVEEEEVETNRQFMRTAHFFKASQVEKYAIKEGV